MSWGSSGCADSYQLTRPSASSRIAAAPYFSKYGDRAPSTTKFSSLELAKRSFSHFDTVHIRGLFATPRLAFSSGLIISIFGAIGLAYPLFNGFLSGFLQAKVRAEVTFSLRLARH